MTEQRSEQRDEVRGRVVAGEATPEEAEEFIAFLEERAGLAAPEPASDRQADDPQDVDCPRCGKTAQRYKLSVDGKRAGHVVACGACGLSEDES